MTGWGEVTASNQSVVAGEGTPLSDAEQSDRALADNAGSRQLKDGAKSDALNAYKHMLVSLFTATLLVIGVIIVLLLSFYIVGGNPPLIFIVVLAGSLGAFFSALARLYNFEDLPKALIAEDLRNLPKGHLLVYSLVPALVGAIAAAILYLIFAAELIKGDLFPTFRCDLDDAKCDLFKTLLNNWHPAQAKDYAKALVWAFIAGFAERLVPSTLQSLSKAGQGAIDEKQSAA
jgi:hypothetical protein